MFEVTQDQIDAWKKQYAGVFRLTAKDANKQAYVRNPNRKELSYISQIKDPIKFNEALLEACWLDGDQEIKTDDTIFMGLSEKISLLLDFQEVELEKL